MELRLPAIKGIGGAPLYLIDRFEDGKSIYDIDFEFIDGVDRHPEGHGLKLIDHLTHNVYRGRMAYWATFYEKLFNFREIRYFDIKGEYTGLTSQGHDRARRHDPHPAERGSRRKGARPDRGVPDAVQRRGHPAHRAAHRRPARPRSTLQMAGVPLHDRAANDVYYEMLEERLPGHGEPVSELQARGILLDGIDRRRQAAAAAADLLARRCSGPVFFEFIQRKGDDGFGEGNFKALFESHRARPGAPRRAAGSRAGAMRP